MIKLSFIVPVYNVAPYLRKCVDSLIHQDFSDYEIILVDDGSTDDSGAICDEYAASSLSAAGTSSFSEAEHSIIPIRVIHQPNAGLSAARNAGVKCAEGKYICFVDSDDYWEPNVLGGLMEQMEREQLDVLRFDYQNVNAQYEVFEPNKEARWIDRCTEVMNGETYLDTRMGYACYAWRYIIRRALLVESPRSNNERYDCLFTEGIHYEDVEWLPRMMLRAKRVNSTTTTVYNYLVRQGSITQVQGNKEKIRKNVEDSIAIITNYKTYQKQHPNCRWLYHMQSNIAVGTITSIARELYEYREKYISQFRRLDVFPVIIADQGKTYRRRAVLINILGIRLYSLIIRYL